MSLIEKITALFHKDKDATNNEKRYISGKEAKRIARENFKITREFEKRKKRPINPDEYVTQMQDDNNILELDDLHTYFYTDIGVVKSVDGVSFSVPKGKVVGIVGESGCGKSVTSLSIMQLVQAPQGQIVSGQIRFNSVNGPVDIAQMPTRAMAGIRGKEISMIFQEPMTSLNPVFTIGNQLDEVSMLHLGLTEEEAKARSIEMLKTVGISMAKECYDYYPHQLSGGMRQRVMIAMSLLCDPRLIIADEPTTALDVTIQAQILDLLKEVKEKINGSIMLITHDLGVIAEMADYVVVMYAGKVVERGTVREIFKNPMHPYTIGLQKSKPATNKKVDRLYSIPGQVPNPVNMPKYCYFRDRCNMKCEACKGENPQLIQVSETHYVACHLYDGKEVTSNE